MRARALAVFVALLSTATFAARDARGECGGGGGGSGGGGGGGGGGGDGGGEPSCVEVSPVVGYSSCRRFGEWDAKHRPPLRLSFGSSIHRLGAGSIDLSAVAEHSDMSGPAAYSIVGQQDGGAFVGGSFDVQLTMALGTHLYAGLEGNIGSLTTSALEARGDNMALSVTPTSVTYAAAAAVFGVRVPLGNWDLRAEAAAGIEAFAVSAETRHEECVLTETSVASSPMIKPRAILERWVSPWISVGAGLGSNLLRRGDTSATLFIGGHLRAFDGGR